MYSEEYVRDIMEIREEFARRQDAKIKALYVGLAMAKHCLDAGRPAKAKEYADTALANHDALCPVVVYTPAQEKTA